DGTTRRKKHRKQPLNDIDSVDITAMQRIEPAEGVLQHTSGSSSTSAQLNGNARSQPHGSSEEAPTFSISDIQHACVLNTNESPSSFPMSTEEIITDKIPEVIEPYSVDLARIASRYKLSNVCVEEFIALSRKIVLDSNFRQIPKNIESWQKLLQFKNILPIFFYWTCDTCKVTNFKELVDNPFSINCCGATAAQNNEHFVILSVPGVLQLFLPKLHNKVKTIMTHRMKSLHNSVQFQDSDFTVTLNVDGVPCFKSSNASLYPVLGFLDGLDEASKRDNVMMFGIWLGKVGGKPDCSSFLSPIVEQFEKIAKEGIAWKTIDGEEVVLAF
ncbi:unnamed protein product, partial [Allacma fusca]